jgi:hypothetical protein
MHGASRFAPDDAHQPRMRVPQRVHGDAAEEVQIFPATMVVHVATLAAHEYHGRRW